MTETVYTGADKGLSPEMVKSLEDTIVQGLKTALQSGDLTAWNAGVDDWKTLHGNKDNFYIPIDNLTVEGQKLEGFNFRQVAFTNSTFEHCYLDNVRFDRCQLDHASFNEGSFKNVVIDNSFLTEVDVKGKFENTRVYESVLAYSHFKGEFVKDETGKSYNSFNHNPIITCSTFEMEGVTDGQKPDLLKGGLQMQNNPLIHNTEIVLPQNDGVKHHISVSGGAMGDHRLSTSMDASCIEIGKPGDITDFSKQMTDEEWNKENRNAKRTFRASISSDNLNGHTFMGADYGMHGYNFKLAPPIYSSESWKNPWTMNFGVNIHEYRTFDKVEFQTIGVGPSFVGMAGKNINGDPSFSYELGASLNRVGSDIMLSPKPGVGLKFALNSYIGNLGLAAGLDYTLTNKELQQGVENAGEGMVIPKQSQFTKNIAAGYVEVKYNIDNDYAKIAPYIHVGVATTGIRTGEGEAVDKNNITYQGIVPHDQKLIATPITIGIQAGFPSFRGH